MKTYADGQLAAAAATLFTGGQDSNFPSDGALNGALTINNTSTSLTETVTVAFRRAGGTSRRLAQITLLPNESAVIDGISIGPGDLLVGSTTDATTVDYVLGSGTGTFAIRVYSANGVPKSVSSSSVVSGAVVNSVTKTTLTGNAITPTAAQLLGGQINHTTGSGAATLTTPTGAVLSAAISGVAVGYSFSVLYTNASTQTTTITAGASGMTVVGTAAVGTGKNAIITFVCTAANTWDANVVLSA